MARRIAILQGARLGSTRVKEKMLVEIDGVSLFEIALKKLETVQKLTGATPVYVLLGSDRPLVEASNRFSQVLVTKDTINAEDWDGGFNPLAKAFEAFDWVICANFICHPFLKIDTICRIVKMADDLSEPVVLTQLKRGKIYDGRSNPVIGIGNTANTKTNPQYHELAHLAYCVPKELLSMREHEVDSLVRPRHIHLDWYEKLDLDTHDDLDHIQAVSGYVKRLLLVNDNWS